jgi:hypothetical protein
MTLHRHDGPRLTAQHRGGTHHRDADARHTHTHTSIPKSRYAHRQQDAQHRPDADEEQNEGRQHHDGARPLRGQRRRAGRPPQRRRLCWCSLHDTTSGPRQSRVSRAGSQTRGRRSVLRGRHTARATSPGHSGGQTRGARARTPRLCRTTEPHELKYTHTQQRQVHKGQRDHTAGPPLRITV